MAAASFNYLFHYAEQLDPLFCALVIKNQFDGTAHCFVNGFAVFVQADLLEILPIAVDYSFDFGFG